MWQCDNLTIDYECYGTKSKYVSTCSRAPPPPRTMSVKVHGGGDGMLGCSFRRLKSAARVQTATFYTLLASPLAAELSQQAAGNCFIVSTAALHCYCIFVARSSLNDATLACFSSSATTNNTTDCRAELKSNNNNLELLLLLCSQKSDTSTFFLVVLGI